jgi:2-hydroxychromene-2-carboxylate isomerase
VPSLSYFLAPQSPWTYLGHQRFSHLVEHHGIEFEYRPIDLLRVFRASGGLPLSERPKQRQNYRMAELKRFSQALAVPLDPEPRHFPVSGDLAAKLLIAAAATHGVASAMQLQGAIGRALWVESRNIADGDTLIELASGSGLDGAALTRAARSAEIESRYQSYTDEAIERGVFGAPTFIVDDEVFWGQDRLEFVQRALEQQAPGP